MQVISKRKEMIFVKEFDGKEIYSIGMTKKDMVGNYINGYMNCKFKKDVHLENKTSIEIKDAWLDFYIKDKKTYPYIFINEFEIVNENKEEKIEKDPYKDIGEEVLKDGDLPF